MTKKTFEERVLESAILRIIDAKGIYSKPSEVRAILRDRRYYVSKRGAVKKVGDVGENLELF